ncbi:Uncharacterised protein [Streptococcus pneumoniae]|nr:Uncharacterised protein [Streptococcus pneumoniae]
MEKVLLDYCLEESVAQFDLILECNGNDHHVLQYKL